VLATFGLGVLKAVIVPLIAMFMLLPLMILTALIFMGLFAMPAIARHVGGRHFRGWKKAWRQPARQRRHLAGHLLAVHRRLGHPAAPVCLPAGRPGGAGDPVGLADLPRDGLRRWPTTPA
jgi:hypothetical protein